MKKNEGERLLIVELPAAVCMFVPGIQAHSAGSLDDRHAKFTVVLPVMLDKHHLCFC